MTCQYCLHLPVCKLAEENISLGTKVKDVVHDRVNFTEEKHGQWEPAIDKHPELYGWVPLSDVVCSVCDLSNGKETTYCPNCGAKMDLEE